MARRLILDTAILITAERGIRPLDQFLHDTDDVSIAAVTAAELLVGIEFADETRRPRRAAFVNELLATIPAEDYHLRIARQHARLLAYAAAGPEKTRGAHDLIIAATAIATSRTLVTADIAADFDGLPDLDILVM